MGPRVEETMHPKVSQKLIVLTCFCLGLGYQGHSATYPGRGLCHYNSLVHPLNGAQVLHYLRLLGSQIWPPIRAARLCTKAKTPRLAHGATPSLVEAVGTVESSTKPRCWGKGASNCLPEELRVLV